MSPACFQKEPRIETDIKMESGDEFTRKLALDGEKEKNQTL